VLAITLPCPTTDQPVGNPEASSVSKPALATGTEAAREGSAWKTTRERSNAPNPVEVVRREVMSFQKEKKPAGGAAYDKPREKLVIPTARRVLVMP